MEIGLRGIDRRGTVLGGCEFVREFHRRLRTGPQVEKCRSIGLAVESHHVELRRRKILPQRDASPMPSDPQAEAAGGSDGGNQPDSQHIAACIAQHFPIQRRKRLIRVATPRRIGRLSRRRERDGLDRIDEPTGRDAGRQVESLPAAHPHITCSAAHHHHRREVDRGDPHDIEVRNPRQQRERHRCTRCLLLDEHPRRPDTGRSAFLIAAALLVAGMLLTGHVLTSVQRLVGHVAFYPLAH